ncbi:MAG TPA: hypothetical protein VLB29_15810 [Nocardioidaceae bacterium]|nr:hypothetical protein [Nocardioidaceae bacterium]
MSDTPTRAPCTCVEDQRGAAVVEAALVISFLLVPILVGVLTLGAKLWHAQAAAPYEPRIAPTEIIGEFTCAELVERVKTTVIANAAAQDMPLGAEQVAVDVVEALPSVGAMVEVTVTLPAAAEGDSATVAGATSRLEQVSVATESCL